MMNIDDILGSTGGSMSNYVAEGMAAQEAEQAQAEARSRKDVLDGIDAFGGGSSGGSSYSGATPVPGEVEANAATSQHKVYEEEILQAAGQLWAEGYSDAAICQACELGEEELVKLKASGELSEYVGEARRDLLKRERNLDKSWDDVETKAVSSLKMELADESALSVGEKLGIAKVANTAKRRRDRDAELAARGKGEAGVINFVNHSTRVINLPVAIVEGLASAQRISREAMIAREKRINESVDFDAVDMDFSKAGEILGVDLQGGDDGSNGTVYSIEDQRSLRETKSSTGHGVVSTEAG